MNAQLQARAGRNSPAQSQVPAFDVLTASMLPLTTAVAPGTTVKVADGDRQRVLGSNFAVRVGPNAGAAEITLTATVRDPNGNVIATDVQNLGPGGDTGVSFNLPNYLPEGYSLWLNSTLTDGVYGNDSRILASFARFYQLLEVLQPLTTSFETLFEAAPGHAIFYGTGPFFAFNRDTVDHDVEVSVDDGSGDFVTSVVTAPAGDVVSLLTPGVLATGWKLRARFLTAIATPGRTLGVFGMVTEGNQQSE